MTLDHWQAGMTVITAQAWVTQICLLLAAFELLRRERATVRIELIENFDRLEAGNG